MHHDGQGGPVDFAEARRLLGPAAAQGHANAQHFLGIMHGTGRGGPVDFAEARRLIRLAAAQGNADAQCSLGGMYHNGQGGPVDAAEARRLLGLAAAQGHFTAQEALSSLDRAEETLRAEQQAAADAMMHQLLVEDAQEKKAKGAPKATKSAKGKKKVTMSHASAAAPSAAASAAPVAPPSSGGASAAATASDTALRDAMTAGDLDGLSAALEEHRAFASEDVLREARASRDRLKERRKQKSQRLRRSHAGAMEALARLQGCASEAEALRAGIAAAETHAGELPALDAELTTTRARLEGLSIGHSAACAAAPASEAAPLAASEEASRALKLDELQQATAGFEEGRLIGSGGFGQVFLGEAIPSLAACQWLQRVAVKRADLSKLELSDLHREVAILRRCNHPHLLPLLGYCLDASAACLVFPLMVGGSLQTRLDLTASDSEYLRRMGHFTAAPKPLTWRQKLRVVVQAVDALLWMHTPTEGKGCTWHRDFKCATAQTAWLQDCLRERCVRVRGRPANILLDEQLNASLGDTGFAKAAQKSGDRSGATTSVWGGAGSLGYCENALRPPDEQTEAYAVGMTLLVVLTGRDPIDIEEVCCEACEDIDEDIGFEDIPVERLAQAGAGWPAEVAGKIKQLYLQLTNKKRAKRLA